MPLGIDMGAPAVVQTETRMESFDQYYERDYRSLVGLAYVLTGSRWFAEDLAQDALVEAHRHWSRIGNYDDPDGWVRRVLVNKSTSRMRRRRTELKGLVRLGQRRHEDVLAPTERSGEIWSAVRKLPTRQAQAIALRYWEDRGVREIASILGTSEETAKTHLKRGRAALAASLEHHREDEL